jgi:hypothetical protein
MVSFARQVVAILVAITMIACQIVPAFAGCHATRHKVVAALSAASATADHHAQSSASEPAMHAGMLMTADDPSAAANQTTPPRNDLCLGNCGCACGLSGAFVLAQSVAIASPAKIAVAHNAPLSALPDGRTPDGPRRPPRLIA